MSQTRPPQHPIEDAVNDALENSPQIDPELVRRVTEQVMKNLHQNMINPTIPPSRPAAPRDEPSSLNQSIPASPTQRSAVPRPPRSTPPPSPDMSRPTDGSGHFSSPLASESGNSSSGWSGELDEFEGRPRRSVTPSPILVTGRRQSSVSAVSSGQKQPPGRKDSGSDLSTRIRERRHDQSSPEARGKPDPVIKSASDMDDGTTLEKVWGPLFMNGTPTARLGQFLRGLAVHLIDNYEPKGSLVVTSSKMLRFFNETRLPEENYPWDIIFGGLPGESQSCMYRKLLCQHHLVQTQEHEAPTVPGLTPRGFETLLTILIQAHPDEEFNRLARAVMHMPISNADNKSERFPKELSRRLLPARPSVQAGQRLVSSLSHASEIIKLKGAQNMPPPPSSAPPIQNLFPERKRQPYASTARPNGFTEEDLELPSSSVQIERERKPYTAKGEGLGKNHSPDRERRPSAPPYRQDNNGTGARPRAGSNRQTQSPFNSASEAMSVPPINRHQMSVGHGPPPAGLSSSFTKSGHPSPPSRNPHSRSEPANVAVLASSQYTSNVPQSPFYGIPNMRDFCTTDAEDDRRYHTRRQTGPSTIDESQPDGRGYPIPPRQPPSINPGHSFGFDSAGSESRRNTWFGSPEAGTDGYGSFGTGYNVGPSSQAPPPPYYPPFSQPGSEYPQQH